MAIRPSTYSSQSNFRSTVSENIEDAVSGELMTKAVTLVPCGHIFNEDTVIQCLARNKLCPLDRQPIERYVLNYTIRNIAETAGSTPAEEEGPSEKAKAHLQRGRELIEKDQYEAAIDQFLQALQLSPNYEKAQAYLDFCLQHTSRPNLGVSSTTTPLIPHVSPISEKGKSKEKTKRAPAFENVKDSYTNLLLKLLEEPSVRRHKALSQIFEEQVEELMRQETEELNSQQQESYKWAQKLLDDNKIRKFVAKKLQQIHDEGSSSSSLHRQADKTSSNSSRSSFVFQVHQALHSTTPSSTYPASQALPRPSTLSPSKISKISSKTSVQPMELPSLPSIAFGVTKWHQYFGDVGVEPPLPSNIQQILQSPCPFWPDKRVEETHLLVLVPTAVNGKSLTLDSLGKLVKSPKQGNASQYSYFNLGDYTDAPASKSHWVLMTRDVLPGSRSKSYTDQQALVASYAQKAQAPYEVPHILDATVAIWMHYVTTGNRLYNDNPLTYTRCQEEEEYDANWPLVVGGFSPAGLDVDCIYYSRYADARAHSGVGGSREL